MPVIETITCPYCGEDWGVEEVDHNDLTGDALMRCLDCDCEWVVWGSPSEFRQEQE